MKTAFPTDALATALLREHPILITKVSAAIRCEASEVADVLEEVLRFLFLVSIHPSDMLTPSHLVDLAWHEFILCTRAYQSFCERRFGRYIHHHPGGSDTANRQQFLETLQCYQRHFGKPDPRYWGGQHRSASCGACEAI